MASFRTNQAVVNRMFKSPSGPAGQELRRRLILVQNRAKVLCPVDLGRLRSSITYGQIHGTAQGVRGSVGTNVVYAAAVHEGSGPPSWRSNPPPARPYLRDALSAANPTRITS